MLMEKKLEADVRVGDIYEKLPYLDDFFDAIISIQTLHHNTVTKIKKLIGEMERILSNGGYILVTVPSKMNQAEKFKLIEKGTYVPLDGREKGLPHHFFTRQEIAELFSNFDIEEMYIDQKLILVAHALIRSNYIDEPSYKVRGCNTWLMLFWLGLVSQVL